MLFNPVANVSGAPDLRIIAGDAAVGQALCDPLTFGGPRFDARLRELLRLVWPSTEAQARLMWGARIAARARQHPIDELVPEVVADVMGVPAAALRAIEAQCRADAAAMTATAPMRLLRAAVDGLVRDQGAGRPETVLEELLFWRGLGPERVSPDDVAELVTALTATLWDAVTALLPALLDAALTHPAADRAALVERVLDGEPGVIGWLRETTQAVLLDGELVPAGERCLLLVEAAEPAGRPAREPLRTLRWLAPESPSGAGATVARLVGNALPMLPTELPGVPLLEELRAAPPRRLRLLLHAAEQSGPAPAKANGRPQARRSRRA